MVEQKERHTWRVREKQNRDREEGGGRGRIRERERATLFYKIKPVKFASNPLTLVPHFT